MAGTEVGSLYYDLNINDKNLKSQLNAADSKVKGFGDRVGQYWGASTAASKKFMLGVAAAGAATIAFGVSSVKAFNESQMSLTQLDAVLKSTGGSAGVTREQAIRLSREIQRTTSLSDEAALAVENMGLTFTAIHKDIFPKATRAAIDMATAMNHGLKPSAEQSADAMKLLGKALQDPDAGLGALHRVGVNTEELKKKFVGLTSVSEKQKLILQELGNEFGGSAAAQAKTFAGRLDQAKNAFNDLQELIGMGIVTALQPLVNWFVKLFDSAGGAEGVMNKLKDAFAKIQPYLPIIAGAITGMLLPAFVALAGSVAGFLLTLAPWAAAGVGVVLLFKKLGISMDDVRKFAGKMVDKVKDILPSWQQVKDVFNGVVGALKDAWKWFSNLSPAVQLLINPLGFLINNFTLVKNIVMSIVNIFMTWFYPSLKALALTIWQNLLPALKQLWDAVVRLWNALNPALMTAIKVIAAALGILLIGALWLAINVLNVAIKVFSAVISVISNVIKWVANLISWFGNLVGGTIHVIGKVASWFGRLPGYVGDAINGVVNWFKKLPGKILNAIGDVGKLLYNAGKNLIGGFINGIVDKFKSLATAVKDAVGKAVDGVKNFLGIHSPSKVFEGIGKNVTEGFVKGIVGSTHLVANAMGDLSSNVLAPALTVNGGRSADVAGAGGTNVRHGDTVVNIGQVNNRQDENWVIRRMDANQRVELRGGTPV